MKYRLRALIVIVVLAGATWAAAGTPSGLAGDWHGTIQAGTIKLHVAMHLGRHQEGAR